MDGSSIRSTCERGLDGRSNGRRLSHLVSSGEGRIAALKAIVDIFEDSRRGSFTCDWVENWKAGKSIPEEYGPVRAVNVDRKIVQEQESLVAPSADIRMQSCKNW
jgi:hypothetical protein